METHRQPLISVIIPVYNTGKYIRRCLDSILENTYRNLEIICVDDGSDDGSANILQGYSDNYGIVAIHQENRGVSAARNAGLRAAKGEYISFVDSDDFIHPRFYENLMRLIDQGADIAVCEKLRINDDYVPDQQLPAHEQISEYDSDNAVDTSLIEDLVWNRIYKRSVLRNIYFAEEVTFAEDSTFNICVFAQNPALRILATDLPLYYYYMREQSLTHTAQPGKIILRGEYFLKELDHVLDPWTRWIYSEAAYKSIFAYRYGSMFTPPPRKTRLRRTASGCLNAAGRSCRAFTSGRRCIGNTTY